MVKKIGTIKDLTKYVIFSIAIVLIYTIVEFIVSTVAGISHDTLTLAVYGFFGGEIVLTALIKIFKLRGIRANDNING